MALARWRRYPREIESDLEVRGIDLGAWHRRELRDGRPILSSRKLIILTDGLLPSDHSWFKLAAYADADKAKAKEDAEKTKAARNPKLASLYRKVPKHLREAV
jgi:hypothetical protein